MTFYVFYGKPRRRTRVHDAECKHCRYGQGQENQHKTGSEATGWLGPFDTLREAERQMNRFGFKDSGHCQTCLGA